MDGLRTEVWGQQKQSNDLRNNQHNPRYANYWAPLTRNGTSCHIQHSPGTPTAGLRERHPVGESLGGWSFRVRVAHRRHTHAGSDMSMVPASMQH